jgi:hypothetical protein
MSGRFRIYCGDPSCTEFLQPSSHVTDPLTSISYATCSSGSCGKMTCTGCRALLLNGTEGHVCKKDENEVKFRQTATEKGYQLCEMCGATVELTEACNHMTFVYHVRLRYGKANIQHHRCGCGNEFCYICGKAWPGIHGCPRYGPAIYDEESYNQDGFHRDTGLNREGLTRRQESARLGDEDDEDDEDDDDEERGEDWDVMQHLEPEQRTTINFLQGAAREEALDQLRIMLFETRGILFGLGDDGNEDSEHDNEEETDYDDETADGRSDAASEHSNEGPVTPNAPHLEAAPHDNADLYSDGAAPHPTSLFGPGPSNDPRLTDPPLTEFSPTPFSALRPSELPSSAPSTGPRSPTSHTLDTTHPMPFPPGSTTLIARTDPDTAERPSRSLLAGWTALLNADAGTGSSAESPATETEDAVPVTPEDGEVVASSAESRAPEIEDAGPVTPEDGVVVENAGK